MSFLRVLPLAIVMVAGPQLLSAIFLATSREWRRNSAAYLIGASLSISGMVVLAFVLGDAISPNGGSGGGGGGILDTVLLVLLAAAMVHTFLTRGESEPPAWMGKLSDASPRFSFRLGFLLLGFFPTDILTSASVGSYLAREGLPVVDAAPFVAVTLFLLGLPALLLLVLGDRGEAALPRIREGMVTNAWVVNEVVLAFFVVIVLT